MILFLAQAAQGAPTMSQAESLVLFGCLFGMPLLAWLSFVAWCLVEPVMKAWADRIENTPHVRPGIEDEVDDLVGRVEELEREREALAVRVHELEQFSVDTREERAS